MLKRKIFFLLDRLKISRAERRSILILMIVLLVLASVNAWVKSRTAVSHQSYAKIEKLFKKRTALMKRKNKKIMAAYQGIPASAVVEDTVPASAKPIAEESININTADVKSLTKLPGIGAVYAKHIIDYRDEHGLFTSKKELLKVRGIGDARLAKISPYIVLGKVKDTVITENEKHNVPSPQAAEHIITQKEPININRANAKALESLPGIGEVYAQNIIDYRDKYGLFTSKKELLKVRGIGDARLAKISSYIVLGDVEKVQKSSQMQKKNSSPKPKQEISEPSKERINVNTAGAQALESLPGIGEAYAQNIIEYRQKNGSFTTFEQLIKVDGIGEKRLQKIKPLIKLSD